jgi:Flp pilus assembly protein TadG
MTKQDDSGVVALITLVVFVVLAGMGSLVLDLGNLYAAHQQAQDSADTAAMAKAVDCVQSTTTSLTPFMVQNAAVDTAFPITCDPLTGTVTVHTLKNVTYGLARVIGKTNGTAHASATAQWFGVSQSQVVIPMAISNCKYPAKVALPSPTVRIFIKGTGPQGGSDLLDESSCEKNPSGQDAPGRFGFIDGPDAGNNCIANLKVGDATPLTNGNSPDTTCWIKLQAPNTTGWSKIVYIPMYVGAGNYTVSGFAKFNLIGYKIKGISSGTLNGLQKCAGSASDSCIEGQFLGQVTSTPIIPGTQNYGVIGGIKLIK